MSARWVRALAAAAFCILAVLPVRAAESAAAAVVEDFQGSLLDVMKEAKALGYRGRYEALSPALERVFNLPVMTRIVAGSHWRKFSPDERKRLTDAFTRMTKATYAHRFDGYSGEKFRVVGETPTRGKGLLVKTELVKSDGERVKLDYLVHRFDDRWQVIDVYLKGSVSELATRRSEYSSVLRRKGLAALITLIDRKVAGYELGNAPK